MAVTKEFKVEITDNEGTLYEIKFEGGGQVPEFLKGQYTSRAFAWQRIKQYLATEKRGAKANGKTTG
ncbi:hypothetical protein [Vibrio phage JSF23]|jgi:hypothetical protein|uniref:Uncharacterized protein n=4 Tax=Icepovirus bengalense TaxID=2846603 RepID=A0A076GB57_9CAUD|nr:hypothetical protein ViPhICP2p10 [Vibrio phage ICP2]ADX87763.1 hypothetical protein TU12-16_00045 [Vibrio phage ICP2_2006_A]AII27054.1 hypothetical protein ICP22011A_0010 [Vibrio phage ICP2_2011_A]ASV43777.1 hypothetical protein [Vibrio phage JSF23]ASV43803.1 hypothetical protein [Vibrio phage JSF27]WJJ54297.1 hypothetical protein [Vibrio phage JPW]